MTYMTRDRYRPFPRRILFVIVGLIAAAIAGMVIAHQLYNNGLKPVSDSQKTQIFTVEQGSTVKEIAGDLEEAKLIRSAWAMELYLHSKQLTDKLQAGTYAFAPNQGTREVVTTMTRGKTSTRLVTILPGRRIDQVRADLINSGFTPDDVDSALQPEKYADLPVMAFKPANVNTLEGLLWPESFERNDASTAGDIVRQSLVLMGENLTAEVQASFAARGLTTYQGLTLASIVTQEASHANDQPQVAQVFYKRLKEGQKLQSDPTAKYGAVLAGRAPSLTYESAYNTYTNNGLPPTPISTITEGALKAVVAPANTDWVYFVAGDDGTTHFSKTLQEHEALTKRYCTKLCR